MADENTIIEGTVKFRDGKKWKSRWCAMRKLSPAADCVHLQLYRDAKARRAGAGGCKAALSLQHFVGCEAGFTLDKQCHTLALVCSDLLAVLAFETRERLLQWQVKVNAHLGEARQYLVLVASEPAGGAGGAGGARLPPGPARLLLLGRRAALTAGVPPRLLGVWDLAHLRRYGVVEGRFCFEGGARCGAGAGLHVLVAERAQEIAADFELAARGRLSPRRRPILYKNNDGAESPKSHKAFRPDTRLSEVSAVESCLPPSELRLSTPGDRCGEAADDMSPYWAALERPLPDLGHGDTASVHEAGGARVSLERCTSCMSKLGALSRSSTAALTPGSGGAQHFSPAWTMDALHETYSEAGRLARTGEQVVNAIDKTEDLCRCPAAERTPGRPPKPTRLELNLNKKPRMPLPTQTCSCSRIHGDENKSRVGPYENYDVPKFASLEVDGEYYDTPKRLKDCLNNELFQITKSSTPNAVILTKPCGCLLKFGRRRKEPTVVDADDSVPPAACPCRRVTAWAQGWISLPYCRRSAASSDDLAGNEENASPNEALYATIDLSRKTRRKTHPIAAPTVQVDDGPLANYENLNFALSLSHYENAKHLLRRAGVTQAELDAIGANLRAPALPAKHERDACRRCGHRPPPCADADGYLMMEPTSLDGRRERAPAGYTPMSPVGRLDLAAPTGGALRSASNPSLAAASSASRARPPRASSADSARFLDDVAEPPRGAGGSSSSIDTLRNLAVAEPAGPRGRARADPGKHSDGDSSEAAPSAAPNRDSSSSNDSGVSSCSLRRGADLAEFELPATTPGARRHYRSPLHGPARRRARSARRAGAAARQVLVRGGGGAVALHQSSKRSGGHAQHVERCVGHVGLHRDAVDLLVALLDGHSRHDAGVARRDQLAAASLREGVPAAAGSPSAGRRAAPAPASLLQPALRRRRPPLESGIRALKVTVTLRAGIDDFVFSFDVP